MKNVKTIVLCVVMFGSIALIAAALPGCEKKSAEHLDDVYAFNLITKGGGFLGVYLDDIDADAAKKFGLREEYGALVKDVVEDSPAEKAGIKKDDVIIEWQGNRVESAAQLKRMVKETPAGRTVKVGLMRDGGLLALDVTLDDGMKLSFDLGDPIKSYVLGLKGYEKGIKAYEGALKEFEDKLVTIEKDGESIIKLHAPDSDKIIKKFMFFGGKPRMGVSLQSMSSQLREYFGVKDSHGILISSVSEGSPAEKAGLKAGDVIISIDGKTIEDTEDVVEIVQEKEEGALNVVVVRNKQEKTFTVTLEKKEKPEEKLKSMKPSIQIDMPAISVVSDV